MALFLVLYNSDLLLLAESEDAIGDNLIVIDTLQNREKGASGSNICLLTDTRSSRYLLPRLIGF